MKKWRLFLSFKCSKGIAVVFNFELRKVTRFEFTTNEFLKYLVLRLRVFHPGWAYDSLYMFVWSANACFASENCFIRTHAGLMLVSVHPFAALWMVKILIFLELIYLRLLIANLKNWLLNYASYKLFVVYSLEFTQPIDT